jgi:hypothetical protein
MGGEVTPFGKGLSMKRIFWVKLAVLVAVSGMLSPACTREKAESPPQPLTKEEAGLLMEARNLLERRRFDDIVELGSNRPDSRAVQLVVEVAKRHISAPNGNIDLQRPFTESDKKEVSLGAAVNSTQTPGELLVTLLYDPSPSVQDMALNQIRQREIKAAVPRLVQMAEAAEAANDGARLTMLVCVLTTMPDPQSIPLLKRYYANPQLTSAEIRQMVKTALDKLGAAP